MSASIVQTFRAFAYNNAWANHRLLAACRNLPQAEFEGGEWKEAKLHADCYVSVESDYYSAPHIHRHKKLKIKITENHVEIFLNLERLAIHPRSRHKEGRRIKIDEHFPPNSVAPTSWSR